MLDGIPLSWLGPGSGWAVAGTFILFMGFGRLIPTSWAEKRIADLKDAHARSEEARKIYADQQQEILTLLRAINAAMSRPREPV